MLLQIGEVQKEDFGTYKCIAKNPRGQTDGQITLTGKFFYLFFVGIIKQSVNTLPCKLKFLFDTPSFSCKH